MRENDVIANLKSLIQSAVPGVPVYDAQRSVSVEDIKALGDEFPSVGVAWVNTRAVTIGHNGLFQTERATFAIHVIVRSASPPEYALANARALADDLSENLRHSLGGAWFNIGPDRHTVFWVGKEEGLYLDGILVHTILLEVEATTNN